ncbi:MAG TPA: hypothetical protein PKE39_05155 [Ignavibacteria bacterium]|nr:hypothetical protein [Ignavibacteria bacterium]HMQ98393.1 hypothetical protein [Ignavibacteria bacterium]
MKYNLVILILISFNLTQNYSQVKDSNNLVHCDINISDLYITECSSLLGPGIVYSLKSKVLSYGINYEYAFAQKKAGLFAAGFSGLYSSNSEDVFDNNAKLKTSVITLGLQCNFNLNNLSSKNIVPFAGLMIGYNYALTRYEFNSNTEDPFFPETKKHSLYIFGQAGVRFFVTRRLAVTIRTGSGNIDKSMLGFGFDYKF